MSKFGSSLSKLWFRCRFSAYDQYVSLYKSPKNSNIVIYGPYNDLFSQVLRQNFEDFKEIDLNQYHFEKEEEFTDSVASSMTEIGKDFKPHSYIKNFPQTPSQAARLDALLDGINLAVCIHLPKESSSKLQGNYLECLACGQLFNTELDSTLPQQPGTAEKCNQPHMCDIVESKRNPAEVEEAYLKEYQPVLEFYEKRGLLLNFIIEEKWSFQETIERLKNEILANVKL